LKHKNASCDWTVTVFKNDLKIMQCFYGKAKKEAK
jgi:hypothetical protein